MSEADKHPQGTESSEEPTILTWRVHPAVHQPRKAVMVAVIIIGLALISAWYAGWLLGILAVMLLGGSLWPFYLPTTYNLTESGIQQRRWPTKRFLAWTYLRRFDVDRRGILLSPFASPSRLDSFRGMYVLRNPGEDGVVEIIGQQLGGPPFRHET